MNKSDVPLLVFRRQDPVSVRTHSLRGAKKPMGYKRRQMTIVVAKPAARGCELASSQVRGQDANTLHWWGDRACTQGAPTPQSILKDRDLAERIIPKTLSVASVTRITISSVPPRGITGALAGNAGRP
ncbi:MULTISPECIES: hypothetical protein [unclassified Mesorhizobium]|uniref:hypothetical protein n=1 Tax=unclassified Mesorhizobium TaxID=325217 RepID=UPI000FDABD71|nr:MULTISPECIES: hypothetical protein [unclassified Mesorhizobium]TGQ05010.1 hypothetical protein EN862_032580 [Mesorhizobium sp. M2E.F.Ca.ET.219.01.1.1]TGS14309.1 hypothetical protein EN852_013875 [Mesorhizobium sp. M2E.F.Ca.ET.209.01.1.1]TGT65548.1 hypothetical protein EN809_032445 [Mesorhizobium sp. M2E.F.Ca.ET.166.01.1.1]TGV97595.1 hypothetical protein EN797_032455 [Mesorhizobium sp. M2E.F.Ca.ET.154.01.1.1]